MGYVNQACKPLTFNLFNSVTFISDFFVNSYFLQDRVVLLQLKPSGLFFLFLLVMAVGAGLTTCFVLSTLQDYLYTVAFFAILLS